MKSGPASTCGPELRPSCATRVRGGAEWNDTWESISAVERAGKSPFGEDARMDALADLAPGTCPAGPLGLATPVVNASALRRRFRRAGAVAVPRRAP